MTFPPVDFSFSFISFRLTQPWRFRVIGETPKTLRVGDYRRKVWSVLRSGSLAAARGPWGRPMTAFEGHLSFLFGIWTDSPGLTSFLEEDLTFESLQSSFVFKAVEYREHHQHRGSSFRADCWPELPLFIFCDDPQRPLSESPSGPPSRLLSVHSLQGNFELPPPSASSPNRIKPTATMSTFGQYFRVTTYVCKSTATPIGIINR